MHKKTIPKQPNIIWMMADQHRGQALSGMGDVNLETPHLDRLAGGGCCGVAGSPLCTPYRAAVLTSRYPHQSCAGHDAALPDGMPTLAHAFSAAGYQTAYFGKWHVDGRENLGSASESGKQFVRRERRGGFDCWLGYENNNAPWDCWLHGHDAKGQEVESHRLPTYEADALTGLLVDYVGTRGKEGQPFFAVVSVQPPHEPYKAPEKWMARHCPEDVILRPNVPPVSRVVAPARQDLAGYYAMIENLDWNASRISAALELAGISEETYFIYFSDHGDMHGSHGCIWKCVPWEESIQVPFIVSRGGKSCTPEGKSRLSTLLNHVDVAPTSLGLCGVTPPEWMTGFNYAPLFQGNAGSLSLPDSAYLQVPDPGYRYGLAPDRERPWRGIITRDGWKYAVLEGQPWLLYNLNEDPYETCNLALDGRFRAERQRLQDRLAAWIADTGDAFALPELPV
jgi:arylsulfatase A-like enzyme